MVNTIGELVKNMGRSGSILIATENENIYKKCFGYAKKNGHFGGPDISHVEI